MEAEPQSQPPRKAARQEDGGKVATMEAEPQSQPPRKAARQEDGGIVGGFYLIGEDLHRNILSRLPALSYAFAACVSRSWNRLCNQILSRPKLLSALSLNLSPEIAVNEALDKVLSEPIRPDFAIVCFGLKWECSIMKNTHELVRKRLSSRIPIITYVARGTMGSDALTDEFKEVQRSEDSSNSAVNENYGIVIIVGFMPGMKVNTIPFFQEVEEPQEVRLLEKFVEDIEEYTASVSGCTSPTGILMFAGELFCMNRLLDKMDYALSEETVIMGDVGGCFLYSCGDNFPTLYGTADSQTYPIQKCTAVALVFATDRDKPRDVGEIKFDLAMSTGVAPVGPTFKGAAVRLSRSKPNPSTWLTARREGSMEELDGQRILHDLENEMENDISCYDLYIGVTKRRKCSMGSRKPKSVSSLAFHEVLGGDEEYLYVKDDGIKTGDTFRFYHPDPETASLSRNKVFEELRVLKQCKETGDKEEVFGGLLFSCCGRDGLLLGRQNADSSAFMENFPGVPLAGMFCSGEIGRGKSIGTVQDDDRQTHPRMCLHVYSAVYLVMSYTPKPLDY